MGSMQEAMSQVKLEGHCPYCTAPVKRVKGNVIYPHRKDLADKDFIACIPCWAYVGCHARTGEPLGRLANKELRAAKMMAHAAFDPIWQNDEMTRTEAYAWLSKQLNLHARYTHIGMFDVEDCKRVVTVCKTRRVS